MRGGYLVALVALAALLSAPQAVAQDYSYPTPPSQSSPYTAQPAPAPPPSESPAKSRGFQGGFNIGVPVWLNVNRSVVRPGADLHFFGGYDIGYAMFGLDLGVMWTPIDLNRAPGLPPGSSPGRSPLTRLYFGPEVRVQVPNRSPILPYLAATFDVNWWRFRETAIGCGVWYCTQVAVFRFAPGFTAKLGIAFRIKRGAHIDLGVKYSLTGPGDFFVQREQWVTPYLGFVMR